MPPGPGVPGNGAQDLDEGAQHEGDEAGDHEEQGVQVRGLPGEEAEGRGDVQDLAFDEAAGLAYEEEHAG